MQAFTAEKTELLATYGADANRGLTEAQAQKNKEQYGEGVAQWQRIVGRAMAELGFIEHHTGEKGAEGEGDVKQLNGAEGDAER